MKKFIAMTLALVMMLAMFAGCSSKEETTTAAPEADIHAKGEGVMTYE